MDKGRRDVRRGTNRLSKKQSGLGCGSPGKSKKGRFKKLGLAGEVKSSHEDHQQEMGCEFLPSSDREIEAKISKLPKRTFKDANGVDHSSVPRKLRSAMKKRNRESVSKPSQASKKLNRSKPGVESLTDRTKKEKLEMESKSVAEQITKDEKEVAETLYALAGMFPTADEGGKLDDASSSEAKALDLPNEKDNQPDPVVEVADEDSTPVPEAGHKMVESSEATVSVPSSAKIEQIDEMPPLEQPENLNVSTGLKPISANETEPPEKKPGVAFTTEAVENRLATGDAGLNSSGLALWPGLSSTVPQSSRDHVLPKPSATKILPWMGSVGSSSKKTSIGSDPSMMELKKLKRCASHIYITRLIRVLQSSKIPPTIQQNEPIPSEGSECGVSNSMAVSDLRSMRNCLETVTTAGDAVNSPAKRYPDIFLLDKYRNHNAKFAQDMTRLAVELYGSQPSRKQSYDFLSLSPGDTRINTNEARIGSASALASASLPHYPHSHSQSQTFPQHHQAKAFSMPQSCHISPAYNNQFPAVASNHQGRMHFPPYLASPLQATQNVGSLALSNQHQRQQQQQLRFWAQCRQAGNSMTLSQLSQYTALQNVKPEPALNPSSQSKIPSLEPFSASYNAMPQQQHCLMATTATMSMNHHPSWAITNRREHHSPLIYEETRTPLQLLCNEQS